MAAPSTPPASRANSFEAPPGFDIQGHRGARGRAPENTLPGFQRALELGVTTLEMDVVVSGDGEVVVSHEPWMSHEICTSPSGVPVSAAEARDHNLYRMSYAEIQEYDCGQRQHPDFPDQQTEPAVKPLLHDAIARVEAYTAEHDRPPVFYNVEIKSKPAWDDVFHPPPTSFARRVLSVVREAGTTARTAIQSFDTRVLHVVRSKTSPPAEPDIGIGLLVEASPRPLSDELETLGFVPDVYGPYYPVVDPDLVRVAHERGLRVVPWTVNERAPMRRLLRVGVDGFITDYPDLAQEEVQSWEASSD